MTYTLLNTINSPEDLKNLSRDELYIVKNELREYILESVSKTGGHLASNLGSVELSIALHYVFNTPNDLLVWDVGHQTYGHKILTGRRDLMHTLRQYNGLCGFPRRKESQYDTFDVGHSSTSVSAALGMAIANKLRGIDKKVVAIIGDGSISAGLAFEAFNNAGSLKDTNLLVILNDNEMSISEPVGAISSYLSNVLTSRFYNSVKSNANKALNLVPPLQKLAHKVEEHVKGMIMPSTLFEELGFNYIGPIDGHDIDLLIDTLKDLKKLKGPQFLHVVTKKGQGYKLAENDPIAYHGVTKFDTKLGMGEKSATKVLTYTQVFSQWLLDAAKIDENFVAITPAMREGSGLVEFAKLYPHRYFDVGIAEQHAVTFAGGIATQGVKPIVAIYSTFLQRAYDQLIHDVALQEVSVLFAIDRAGLVADGPTHSGVFDLAFARCIPELIIMAPSDEKECYNMLQTGLQYHKSCLVRYPRGNGAGVALPSVAEVLPIGKGRVVRNGYKIALLSFGSMLANSLLVAEDLDASVWDMRFVKPLDTQLLNEIIQTHQYIVTLEEGVIMGGAGSAVLEYLVTQNYTGSVLNLGIPDEFIMHGDPKTLLTYCGLDYHGIKQSIMNKFKNI